MILRLLANSPQGDIPLDEKTLGRPFLLRPSEPHPHLTLRRYFQAIEDFLFLAHGEELLHILSTLWNKAIRLEDLDIPIIRSEKHGAYYHLSSVEFHCRELRAKFALSTAISEEARQCLLKENETLSTLRGAFQSSYLPHLFMIGEISPKAAHKQVPMVMAMAEWFEGFCEWHLSRGQKSKNDIILWATEGYRPATGIERHALYKRASMILTYYYNTLDYRQISRWHHAAGDFIVKPEGHDTEVRLTTVRNYESMMGFHEDGPSNPAVALLFFFLHLTIQMRLDRLNGTGELVWAEETCLRAAVEGFIQALRVKDGEGHFGLGSVEKTIKLLKAFDIGEIGRLFHLQLEFYERNSPAEAPMITRLIESHTQQVHGAIQGCIL